MFYGGVDPGLSGAVAFYDPDTKALSIIDMPVVAGEVNAGTLSWELRKLRPTTEDVWVERVHSMPKQGVSSTFKFGASFGVVIGILSALEFTYLKIEPSAWKRAVALPAGAPKELSVKRAIELFPRHAHLFTRPKLRGTGVIALDGRAEAALIAWLCSRKGQ